MEAFCQDYPFCAEDSGFSPTARASKRMMQRAANMVVRVCEKKMFSAGLSGKNGQADDDSQAGVGVARGDVAAMRTGDLAGDGKPQAHAAGVSGA